MFVSRVRQSALLQIRAFYKRNKVNDVIVQLNNIVCFVTLILYVYTISIDSSFQRPVTKVTGYGHKVRNADMVVRYFSNFIVIFTQLLTKQPAGLVNNNGQLLTRPAIFRFTKLDKKKNLTNT